MSGSGGSGGPGGIGGGLGGGGARPDWVTELKTELAGRYEIERELGRGAMARVYLAQDARSKQPVALKVLPPELASVNGERFLREIRITSQLQHPNILPLLDSGAAGRYYWFTMPLVDGETLRQGLKSNGPLGPSQAFDLAHQVGGALAHAHANGVVHRDLKPDNVMRLEGRWVVLDFGLARAAETQGQITGVNMPLGTPPYMSPEQITGAAEADARADIYSFGCVLYEVVTGRPPFVGPSIVHLFRSHMQEIPLAPSAVRPGVSAAFDRVLLRALEKAPESRYQRAEDLLTDLGPVEPEKKSPSKPAGFLGRLFGKTRGST